MTGPDEGFTGDGATSGNGTGEDGTGAAGSVTGPGPGPGPGRLGGGPSDRLPPRRASPRAATRHGTGGTGEGDAPGAGAPAAPGYGEETGTDAATAPGPEAGRLSQQGPHGGQSGGQFDHRVLKSLLGAWALAACSAEETAAVEAHLSDCGPCADEALRLRDAVGLLHPEDSLDLDPSLRSRVLEGCMARRPPRIPVPDWAAPYDAESSRLDALLRDMAGSEWLAPVLLRWFDGRQQAERETTVGGVISHLLAVDGVVAASLGLPDPLDARAARAIAAEGTLAGAPPAGGEPAGTADAAQEKAAEDLPSPGRAPGGEPGALAARTEECWRSGGEFLRTSAAREPWREQGRAMLRTVSFAGGGVAGLDVGYGDFTLPVRDAMLDRAFECWMHAEDIAEAIDYPYTVPQGEHMHHMVDLAARLLPGTLAWRRRTGLAGAPRRLTAAGAPGRALHLEVEGDGGGHWYIPLDSPAAAVRPEDAVAHVALDRYEFCQLVAGRVPPLEAAAGHGGDREAVRDVLFAAASLSRM